MLQIGRVRFPIDYYQMGTYVNSKVGYLLEIDRSVFEVLSANIMEKWRILSSFKQAQSKQS